MVGKYSRYGNEGLQKLVDYIVRRLDKGKITLQGHDRDGWVCEVVKSETEVRGFFVYMQEDQCEGSIFAYLDNKEMAEITIDSLKVAHIEPKSYAGIDFEYCTAGDLAYIDEWSDVYNSLEGEEKEEADRMIAETVDADLDRRCAKINELKQRTGLFRHDGTYPGIEEDEAFFLKKYNDCSCHCIPKAEKYGDIDSLKAFNPGFKVIGKDYEEVVACLNTLTDWLEKCDDGMVYWA